VTGVCIIYQLEFSMLGLKQIITFSISVSFFSRTDSARLTGKSRLFSVLFPVLCLFCMPAMLLAQTQLGSDIVGAAAYDELGSSVSLSADGSRMAVGARSNDGNGFDSGHVRVYQWQGGGWVQLGSNIEGEADYDESGISVALSPVGDRVAIGAPKNDGNGFDSGHVRVYQWSGTSWVRLGADIDGEAAYDESGKSVSFSLDGDYLAIGAPKNNGNGADSGHVRVYQWSGNKWEQLGSDIDGEAPGDESGWSVSLSSRGRVVAVGAYKNDGTGIDSGHVRVYKWVGNKWQQIGADIDGETFGDESGSSVSLSSDGQRIAIGAYKNDGNGIESGHARVYQWLAGSWTQLGADIDGETFGDNSGWSLSLSSEAQYLAVGAYNNGGSGINSGHVRFYQWLGGAWVQVGTDIDGEAYGDRFGWSVSLSSYANRLAVGGPLNINNSGVNAGQARIFDVSMFNPFTLNAGLNDAWYYPKTDGQGFFINVYPVLDVVALAWFTYDTELPPPDATANLGDPGHRWFTALGPLTGNQVTMEIEMTSGGLFDTPTEITRTDPPGSDGTIVLTFYNCNAGTVEYDIPSIKRQGTVHIQRVATDNVLMCEALGID
jgi:hypothetical protein